MNGWQPGLYNLCSYFVNTGDTTAITAGEVHVQAGLCMQAVFDYIDVQQQAASFKPDAYNLVNSYPRKVCWDGLKVSLES